MTPTQVQAVAAIEVEERTLATFDALERAGEHVPPTLRQVAETRLRDAQRTLEGSQETDLEHLVRQARDCRCPHCVSPQRSHYGAHYCKVMALLVHVKGQSWVDQFKGHLLRLGAWGALHPMENGRTVECRPVPVTRSRQTRAPGPRRSARAAVAKAGSR